MRTSPSDHQVVVYRKDSGWRKYKLVHVNDNEVKVYLPRGKICTFYENDSSNDENDHEETKTDHVQRSVEIRRTAYQIITRSRKIIKDVLVELHSMTNENDKNFYIQSRMEEINA